jgi:hypothetical protein
MKRMPVSDWAHFQQLFCEFQLLYCRGDPDLALFARSIPGVELDEIYITGPKLEAIERLPPEDWSDADPACGEGILLLAGAPQSWKHLGLSRSSPDGV